MFTGLPFATGQEVEPADAEKKEAFLSYLETCSNEEKAAMYLDAAAQPDADLLAQTVARQMDGLTRADIEAMVTDQYAQEMGVDAATVTGYIAGWMTKPSSPGWRRPWRPRRPSNTRPW